MVLAHVCLPIDLDAFVLNQKVCDVKQNTSKPDDQGIAVVAPITQPNYANLRLSTEQIQHDILPRIDIHNCRDGRTNPRVSNLYQQPFQDTTPKNPAPDMNASIGLIPGRQGVYLHWSVPRAYRSAKSQAADPSYSKTQDKEGEGPVPIFPLVPNRWLVIRLLQRWAPDVTVDRVKAWVIESDRLRTINQLTTGDNGLPIDLETDVAPFVAWSQNSASEKDFLSGQAEKYIGIRTPLEIWREQKLMPEQKVDLTIMNSSNPLFADYTPCNANVFSMKDNFFYKDSAGRPQFLQSATCDYIVMGWHSDITADPLGNGSTDPSGKDPNDLQARLTRLFCKPPQAKDDKDVENASRLTSSESTRLICHAAKYGVVFSPDLPSEIPANKYAHNFTTGIDMEPLSIGTTALDAVLAFFQAHSGKDDTLSTTLFGGQGATAAKRIMEMQELLYATQDDYDSRIKASDLVFAHNFARSQGGSIWRYDKKKSPSGPPVAPSSDPSGDDKKSEVQLLQEINEYQRLLDVATFKLDQLRWALFSEWFKHLSDPSAKSKERLASSITRVSLLRSEAKGLQKIIDTLQKDKILPIAKRIPLKKVAQDPFFKKTDPTLCIAGIDAGWDPLYVKDTPTRFADRLAGPGSRPNTPDISNCKKSLDDITIFTTDKTKGALEAAKQLSETLKNLLTEASRGNQSSLQGNGHRDWSGQPFKPQFVEWEGVYHHVEWSHDNWDIQLSNGALTSSNHSQVVYVNPSNLSKLSGPLGPREDQRPLSGRILVLPQPSFALSAVIKQVLDGTPKDQFRGDLKDPKVRDDLKRDAQSLRFISGQLEGVTNGLLTMVNGQHVQPNIRNQDGTSRPMQDAITAASQIQMQKEDFDIIAGETGPTPFGSLVNFDAPDVSSIPFKPVQHGQFAITKLLIVDKFGQVIACPFPKRKLRVDGPSSVMTAPKEDLSLLHPCLSEQLVPSLLGDALNTVYTTKDTHNAAKKNQVPMTPFVQLNPSINQEARVNAHFLRRVVDKDSSSWWEPCDDWMNPIFGWIIVNYADSALQFFTHKGNFYASILFGGPTGTIESVKWQPFDEPPDAKDQVSAQLTELIAMMVGKKGNDGANYLKALWDIIRSAIPSMPFPPSEYASYANAIVGKPLALVNAGWSIELAQAPFWRQNTLPVPPPVSERDTIDPLRTQARDLLSSYNFKVKIGDAERPFDGVVAYWDTDNRETVIKGDKKSSTKTDFSKIWSYTSSDLTKDVGQLIEPSKFPSLSPYFLHPDYANFKDPPLIDLKLSTIVPKPKSATATAPAPEPISSQATAFSRQHTSKLMVKSLLIDPYTPIHLYSGILPIKSLRLADWTIQQAMKTMTAFFTVGPLLVSRDVPKVYDPKKPLKADTWLTTPAATTSEVDPISLPIASAKGTWNWLQPYLVEQTLTADGNGKTPQGVASSASSSKVTKFNALSVGVDDGRLRLDPAPYTFVEGFLQLAKSLE